MGEERYISVVIPNRNGAATIGECLRAACSSNYSRFEVVVVDDGSTDASVEIINRFPCRLIRLEGHGGVSKARNAGARASRGQLLFFIDNDCLLQEDALSLANENWEGMDGQTILGGTYTTLPRDSGFFSVFQSIFIHYFETKRKEPDYIAAHAMIIDADLFKRSGGFIEDSFIGFAASVEDVEFSHRLRRAGCRLVVDPRIQVEHIFRFSFNKSLRNAVKKTRYWTVYLLLNRDLLSDSGTASRELKINVAAYLMEVALLIMVGLTGAKWLLGLGGGLYLVNSYLNRGLLRAFRKGRGRAFAVWATLYYTLIYPIAVSSGALAGSMHYLWRAARPAR